MANFKVAAFAKAFIAAGKHFSSFELGQSFGIISTNDPACIGRRTGQYGEYLSIKTPEGKVMNIALAFGSPKGARKFEIIEMIATEDVTIGANVIHEGDKSFKAVAIVEEKEEE
jgi:hypothetical protein